MLGAGVGARNLINTLLDAVLQRIAHAEVLTGGAHGVALLMLELHGNVGLLLLFVFHLNSKLIIIKIYTNKLYQ